MFTRHATISSILGALVLICSGWPSTTPAYAAGFTVNNISDVHDAKPGDGLCEIPNGKGVCTLRAAIDEANALAGKSAHQIAVPAGTYLLFLGELTVQAHVEITGAGAATTIVDGQRASRILTVNASAGANLKGLTLRNGNAGPTNFGGGILNLGSLTLADSVVRNNLAGNEGGGIANNKSSFLTLLTSTVSYNESGSGGGGILNYGNFTAVNSTISNNKARFMGGGPGIYRGGGLLNGCQGCIQGLAFILNTTIAENAAEVGGGAGIAVISGEVDIKNSIINSDPINNCYGTLKSFGYNLESGKTCGLTAAGDKPQTIVQLGPLQDNGGPTPTHAPQIGSAAIDGGTNFECPAFDQRGVGRPADGDGNGTFVCDIGAYERLQAHQ